MFAAQLCETYPFLEQSGLLEELVPKKGIVNIAKWCVRMHLRLTIFR
jgi:hypothetical protein